MKPKIIVILGPTASGKTDLAVKLAQKFNGEIVTADSRTIYKGMDIGTAKVLGERREIDSEFAVIYQGIPHYLIDCVYPNEEYSVVHFKDDAQRIIDKIIKRGKTPFLVGGTGLYIQALMDNLDVPEVPPDKELRERLERDIETLGLEAVYEKLKATCPILASSVVDPQNPRRIIRAMEICLKNGDLARVKGEPFYDALKIGIKLEKEELNRRIDARVDKMMEGGLVEENKKLLEKYDSNLPALSGIGYREIIKYLRGELPVEDAVELIKLNTRHFVKRQMTWFKRDESINWVENLGEGEKLVSNFLHFSQ